MELREDQLESVLSILEVCVYYNCNSYQCSILFKQSGPPLSVGIPYYVAIFSIKRGVQSSNFYIKLA
jgi:hypothetical protein